MNNREHSILVVDDEPANTELLARMLDGSYLVQVANDGHAALRLANGEERPELILLDVMMPEMDGFEVCRRLKADEATKDISVVFVTAMGDNAAEEVGLNLGAVDYITKPLSMPVVLARVRIHMDLRRKTAMLEAMSYIDGLTDVPNRRRFDTQVASEWERWRRDGAPLAVVMFDIDHFKALNDHYGHGTGDLYLREVAAAMSRALQRPGALLARYGGEEFVALLPNTSLDEARRQAEGLRQAVARLHLVHDYSRVASHVTVSAGVGVAEQARDLADLLGQADRALYEAKAGGRNRVCVATSATATEVATDAGSGDGQPRTAASLASRIPAGLAAPAAAEPTALLVRQRKAASNARLMHSTLERLRGQPAAAAINEDLERLQACVDSLQRLLEPLPAAAGAAELTAIASDMAEPLAEALPPARPDACILIVDDSRANQLIAEGMLRKLGYVRLLTAHNGSEALAVLREQAVDLVLMDRMMPVMDGLEATRRIRSGDAGVRDPGVPILAMTAGSGDRERAECLDAGMTDYLGKPLDSAQLRDKLDAALAAEPEPLPRAGPRRGEPHTLDALRGLAGGVAEGQRRVFDSDGMLRRMGRDRETATRVIAHFLRDAPQRLASLQDGLAAGDAAAIRFAAHSLKGLAGGISAHRLEAAAARLEADSTGSAPLAGNVERLHREYQRLVPRLLSWIGPDGHNVSAGEGGTDGAER